MSFRVVVLRKAESDMGYFTDWIAIRSPAGAAAWLDAFNAMAEQLSLRAPSFGAALEDADCSIPLKQALFCTRRGAMYRAVFTVVGDEARILRIRGPGQRPLDPGELW